MTTEIRGEVKSCSLLDNNYICVGHEQEERTGILHYIRRNELLFTLVE